MSHDSEDGELQAIQQVLAALQPLESEARARVVQYVFQRLGIPSDGPRGTSPSKVSPPGSATIAPVQSDVDSAPVFSTPLDIRSLYQDKQPRSANEMAAVVAYYLAELAPPAERKDDITVADLKKYFKQAGFPLPKAPSQTLLNAKNAGYLDSGPSRGFFRLNPVGHNLVVHTLPASEGSRSGASGRTAKRGARKAKKAGRPSRKRQAPKRRRS